METPLDGLMPIGRFSEATRLSVKGLRLYGELGLLQPAHVDQATGYRYYSPTQVGRAEAIRRLRAANMPLEKIRAVLDSAPESSQRVLQEHREDLLQQSGALVRAVSMLTEIIEGRRSLVPYEIETKTMPEHKVAALALKADLSTIGAVIGEGFGTLMGEMGRAGLGPAGIPYIVYLDVIDGETEGRLEICVPIVGDLPDGRQVAAKQVPATEVVSTVHVGPYSDIAPAYHALMAWMQGKGIEPAGAPREIYLSDPKQVPETDLRTEVAWPIRTGTTG